MMDVPDYILSLFGLNQRRVTEHIIRRGDMCIAIFGEISIYFTNDYWLILRDRSFFIGKGHQYIEFYELDRFENCENMLHYSPCTQKIFTSRIYPWLPNISWCENSIADIPSRNLFGYELRPTTYQSNHTTTYNCDH